MHGAWVVGGAWSVHCGTTGAPQVQRYAPRPYPPPPRTIPARPVSCQMRLVSPQLYAGPLSRISLTNVRVAGSPCRCKEQRGSRRRMGVGRSGCAPRRRGGGVDAQSPRTRDRQLVRHCTELHVPRLPHQPTTHGPGWGSSTAVLKG
jgi:hypothetical protein